MIFKTVTVFIAALSLVKGLYVSAAEYPSPIACETFSKCAELILKAASRLALPIAVVFVIYSGFLFVTAQGSEDKLKTAKSTLAWTLIGLFIVVGAWALAVAFQDFFSNL